jgi:hypothetical protein
MDYKSQIKEFHGIDLPYGRNEEIYLPDGREFMVDKWEFTGNDITYNNVYNLGTQTPIEVTPELDALIVKNIAKSHNLVLGDADEFDPNYASKSSVAPFATRPPRGNLNENKHLSLKRLMEQSEIGGDFYNVGHEFSEFKHLMDSSTEQLKQKFQTAIGAKLNGKRILATASRGYHQPSKQFEFDVSNVIITDPYNKGEQVIIARDMHTSKPKEYFLDVKSQIKILGPATGQSSPQKGVNPAKKEQPKQIQPVAATNNPQAQHSPIKETEEAGTKKQHAAYSIDSIVEDISTWLPPLLKKQNTPMVDFVKKIGWTDERDGGVMVSVFEIRIPTIYLKYKLEKQALENFILNNAKQSQKITDLELDKSIGEYVIQVKKIYRKE